MEAFWQKVRQIIPLSKEGQKALAGICREVSLSKGDHLLRMGGVCDAIYFVETGIVRFFYYKNGKDVTEWIAPDGHFCFSITSFFRQTPSRLGVECLEDSRITCLSRDGLMKLSEERLDVSQLYQKLLAGSLIGSQERMDAFLFETARQRYRKLLAEHPDLLLRVPLHHIASFLGMSPETLSRIRAEQ